MNNKTEATSDDQLVAEAHKSSAAFGKLYRRHYRLVYGYCVRRLFERETAKDLTSEVFLTVVNEFPHFKGTAKEFRNWLYRIATNAVNQHFRKTRRREKMMERAREGVSSKVRANPTSAEITRCERAALEAAVLSLKPRDQTIITLRFFKKLKFTQIAEIVRSRPATVRKQSNRALAKLREKLVTAGIANLEGGIENG